MTSSFVEWHIPVNKVRARRSNEGADVDIPSHYEPLRQEIIRKAPNRMVERAALIELAELIEDGCVDGRAKNILNAFDWADTPSGYDFWDELYYQ